MQPIDLRETYLLLEDHAARQVTAGAAFWEDLMSGDPKSDDARAVAATEGAMLSAYDMEADWTNWENHPAGDEVIVMLKGQAEFILELPQGLHSVHIGEGECCIVPKGVWHTANISAPCRMLALTPGKGTHHRPR